MEAILTKETRVCIHTRFRAVSEKCVGGKAPSDVSRVASIVLWHSAGYGLFRMVVMFRGVHTPLRVMLEAERYLQFDNIDMSKPIITARCSVCDSEFSAKPKPKERTDDVLLRIRAAFNDHVCN